MRFRLKLQPIRSHQKLGFNYNHPFASWVYSRIEANDSDYAAFLHQRGYEVENTTKRFKHFSFSSFEVRNKAKKVEKGEDFMLLSSHPVFVTVSFYVEKAAEDFIIGLFRNQKIRIFDRKYTAEFMIEAVESLGDDLGETNEVVLKATSPMVIAEKKDDGNDTYLEPTDPRFAYYFAQNLLSKYESVYGKGMELNEDALLKLIQFRLEDVSQMKSRLVAIKQDRNDGTKIRGFENFVFTLKAPPNVIEVGYYGGFGKFTSSAGMGFCEVVG